MSIWLLLAVLCLKSSAQMLPTSDFNNPVVTTVAGLGEADDGDGVKNVVGANVTPDGTFIVGVGVGVGVVLKIVGVGASLGEEDGVGLTPDVGDVAGLLGAVDGPLVGCGQAVPLHGLMPRCCAISCNNCNIICKSCWSHAGIPPEVGAGVTLGDCSCVGETAPLLGDDDGVDEGPADGETATVGDGALVGVGSVVGDTAADGETPADGV